MASRAGRGAAESVQTKSPNGPLSGLRPSWLLALLVVGALGCSPEIGDACSRDSDCSQTGDRLCDITQPGGYCTQYGCEPGSCPEEGACVGFRSYVSLECRDPQEATRLQRLWCLRRCEGNWDCRGDYECAAVGQPDNRWGASVVEYDGGGIHVCLPKAEFAGLPADAEGGYCQAGRPTTDDGTGGAGGAAATGGAAAGGASTGAAGAGTAGAGN